MKEKSKLSIPRESRRSIKPNYDPETLGRLSERFARFIGTARFLVYMTVFVVGWVIWNSLGPKDLRFDEYPFIFLTLLLSLQASYAAPLILLAQNRQADRGLGGSDGQYEKHENLPCGITQIMRKSDEVHIHREQHELNRHQQDDHVTSVQKNTDHSNGEQNRAKREEMRKGQRHTGFNLSRRRRYLQPHSGWIQTPR